MRYRLNSLKGAIQGNILGSIIGVTKGDTMSLDCVSYLFVLCQIADGGRGEEP